MLKYMLVFFVVLSGPTAFATGYVKVDGKRYQVNLTKIECVPPDFNDVLNPAGLIVKEEMKRAECQIFADLGEPYDCAAIDRAFVAKSVILSELRERGHCSCKTGPSACLTRCKDYLPEKDCSSICLGDCDLPFPTK